MKLSTPQSRWKNFRFLHAQHEYPGTGIGLAMVKRIVELLNGRVGVDPLPKQGSCFWIELSKAPPEAPVEPPR